MKLTLIAAIDADGAIGRAGGGLPWHLPDEAAHFRAYCAGQWLLVGRRTFEEMTGWFRPDHRVLLLTRHPLAPATAPVLLPSLTVTASVPNALAIARQAGAPELVVIGGARTYAQTLPLADRLVLSRLALRSGGTVRFPEIEWTDWSLHHRDPDRLDRSAGISFGVEYWERHPK